MISTMKIKDIPSSLWNELHLGGFNITDRVLDSTFTELKKEFNSAPSLNDVLWRIFNNQILNSNDLNFIGYVYRTMATLAENEGKDYSEYLNAAHESELKDLLNQGVIEIVVENKHTWKKQIARTKICQQGKKLIGKKFTIEYALENLPIPTNCEKGSKCICKYKASDNDDLERFERDLKSILNL
jgi:hypothetical protein